MATATPDQTSAIALFRSMLTSWGIAELVPDAQKLVLQGLGADSVTLALQQTAAYKKRFAGNALREKAGLPVLAPAEYVATEASYAQVLRQYGLPKGFYDSRDDFTNFIAHDVSAQELQQRASDAQEKYMLGPAENRDWWRNHYGGTDAEAIAGILDPTRALPIVQRRLTASAIGGAAAGQGLQVGTTQAEALAAAGVTDSQAQQGYAQIATGLPTDQAIAQRFGDHIGQAEEEAATFGTAGAADALEKKKRLASSEASLFGGKAAADTSSLSRPAAGSY